MKQLIWLPPNQSMDELFKALKISSLNWMKGKAGLNSHHNISFIHNSYAPITAWMSPYWDLMGILYSRAHHMYTWSFIWKQKPFPLLLYGWNWQKGFSFCILNSHVCSLLLSRVLLFDTCTFLKLFEIRNKFDWKWYTYVHVYTMDKKYT